VAAAALRCLRVSQPEHDPVAQLEDLREPVERDHAEDVRAARVARPVESHQDRHDQERQELHEGVQPEVARAGALAEMPLEHAHQADRHERTEQSGPRPDPDALGDDGGQQGHERHRHRQPVPDQPVVVRREVVVGGAEAGEQDAHEEDDVGPPLRGIDEGDGAGAEQRGDPEEAHDGERQVGQDVQRVRHAQERAVVGEAVVRRVLRDGGNEQGAGRRQGEDGDERPPVPGSHGS
jgi:hypothetical protein